MKRHPSYWLGIFFLFSLLILPGCPKTAGPHPFYFLENSRSLQSKGKKVRLKTGAAGPGVPGLPTADLRISLSDKVEIGFGGYTSVPWKGDSFVAGRLELKWISSDNLAFFLSLGGSSTLNLEISGVGMDAGFLWTKHWNESVSLYFGARIGGVRALTTDTRSLVGSALIGGLSFLLGRSVELSLEAGVLPAFTMQGQETDFLISPYSAISVNWLF